MENKIQNHTDLISRHVKKYDGKDRQELLRLDKNFNIKDLINLIIKMKEIMENDKELLMEQERTKQKNFDIQIKQQETKKKEEETKQKEEETKQKEEETKQKEEETKQKEEETKQKEEETKQLTLQLEIKKLDLEMKKLELNQQIQEEIPKLNKNQKTLKQFLIDNAIYEEHSKTTLEELRKKYSKYIGKDALKLDNKIITNLDERYIISTITICRYCKKQLNLSENRCCNLYNRLARTNRKVVLNLILKKII